MRIVVVLILSLLFISCELEIDNDNIHFEKIPAFNIQTPENLVASFEYDISFDYALPNGCYEFYEIGFDQTNNNTSADVLIITPYAQVQSNANCTQVYMEDTCSFSFRPVESGNYILKFWIGQTNSGIDQYNEYELIIE